MKFSRHLSSHLTPEWRKQYIQYTELKKLVYDMVGSKKRILRGRPHNREEDEVPVVVDEVMQEEFFRKVSNQLETITQFFRKEESKLQFSLSELEDQVLQLGTLSVRKVGKQRRVLKRAMSEFYLNLILLQNFQQLNHTGFRKILKKYDKLARSTRGKAIFKEDVSRAYFWTSHTVTDMITQVEKIMIQALEEGDRSQAMNRLRVPPLGTEHKRSHWATYRAGLFCGILLLSVVVVCIAFAVWPEDFSSPHLEPSLRALRAGLVLSVWFFGFAINTFGWRTAGVNNVLIFEFDPRNYLNFVQLFEVAGMMSVIWMSGLYLTAFAPWLHIPVYVGPLVMYATMLTAVFLPLPILYHHSRLWFLSKMGRIVCAPFCYVKFADFWLADQLTSLSLAMLDTEYFFCYMFYGIHAPKGAVISCGQGSYGLRVIVASLPAWWRFAQCLRRYYDTRNANPHLINAGKYSTSFFVAILSAVANALIDVRLSFLDQSVVYLLFFGLWVVAAVVSTSYTFSWDILMDWSLFPNIPQRCCRKNALLLRQDRIYSYRIYYFLALVEDFLFRILWIFNISVGHHVLGVVNDDLIATLAGVLEIVRRFIWNFFRVENEHVNNVGQFRAVRDISLYPVDLTELEEWEEGEGEADGGPGQDGMPPRRQGSRRLSTTLQEIADRKTIRTTRQRRVSQQRAGGHVALAVSQLVEETVEETVDESVVELPAVTLHLSQSRGSTSPPRDSDSLSQDPIHFQTTAV